MRAFYLGILVIALASCASFANYKTYGIAPLEGSHLMGTLLGHEPKDDLPLSECEPDPEPTPEPSPSPGPTPEPVKGKCRVLFESEWTKVLTENAKLREQLKACQAGHCSQ